MLWANRSDGFNSYYIGYNYEMSEQFITDCADWAKLIGAIAQQIDSPFGQVENYIDEEGILSYRLRFPNGKQIVALSSRPTNLRSKKGRIVIDEVAFHKDVEELLKAAMAVTIWGGQLRLISTHDGEDNPFNDLVKKAKTLDSPYSLHTVTLGDAIASGLYRRICQIEGRGWSLEKEFEWEAILRQRYGVGAAEELDVIPNKAGSGLVFAEPWFIAIGEVDFTYHLAANMRMVRFWDLAATEKKLTGPDPCFTAGVKIGELGGLYYVLDCIKAQLGPADIDDLMRTTAEIDGTNCAVRWELEGGSAGVRDAAAIAKNLRQFDAQAVRPRGDKVRRARPWASQLKASNVRLLEGDWNKEFIKDHTKFPASGKDTVDASSGAYTYLVDGQLDPDAFHVPHTAITPQAKLRMLKRKGRRFG